MQDSSLAHRLYAVEGVKCSQCLKKIRSLRSEVKGIKEVSIDMGRRTLRLVVNPQFDSPEFVSKTQDLGFDVRELKKDQEVSSRDQRRSLLSRLGVAGAMTGNIMLLSYAIYLGAPSEFFRFFIVCAGVLFLPVLFYSAAPLFHSSLQSAKKHRPSIDQPLALAIAVGSSLSYYNLFIGRTEIYFDSLAMLVFLILATRFFVASLQQRYLSPVSLKDILSTSAFWICRNGKKVKVPIDELKTGDLVEISSGEKVPADGILVSSMAEVDNSLLTGESDLVSMTKWSTVYAGSVCHTDGVRIKLLKDSKGSRVSDIIEKLNVALSKDSSIVQLTDSVAHIFTLTVFAVGAVFFVSYSFVDMGEALNRVLALFVIACPCALAVTAPLILRFSAKKSFKKGFLVKYTDVFEKLSQAETIIFDKTGTLTMGGASELAWTPERPTGSWAQIIASLEMESGHPIAKSILRSLSEVQHTLEVQNFKEIAGVGVFGEIDGQEYSIRKIESSCADIGVFKGEALVFSLRTQDFLRQEAVEEFNLLQKKGLNLYMLTGDTPEKAQQIADRLLIPKGHVRSGYSPEEKWQWVKRLSSEQKIVYVGDGLNDSLAMTEGLLGVSVRQSVEATFSSSGVHILGDGIAGLNDLHDLSLKVVGGIQLVLGFSLAYNFIFGLCALMGVITPLVASVLMPLSSLSLLALGLFLVGREKS